MADINFTLNYEFLVGLFSEDRNKAFGKLMEAIMNQVLKTESTEQLGAENYERSKDRRDYRNGTRKRELVTRIGKIELDVPRHRDVPFKTVLFENYQRNEQALIATMMEMVIGFNGTVEEATFSYIIRDHDMSLYEQKKAYMQKCVDFINEKYGEGTATVEIRHQYYNMRKEVEPHYHIVEKAKLAMEMEGIVPNIKPIRGGTDGANLSFMGLPCPNIFAGGHNFHGKMEFIPLESMEKASKVILNIIGLFAE